MSFLIRGRELKLTKTDVNKHGFEYVKHGAGGSELICKCPRCDDSSGHLYINSYSGKYFCHKCNFKGVLKKGAPAYSKRTLTVQQSEDLSLNLEGSLSLAYELYKKSIPLESTNSDFNVKAAFNYLIKRGLTEEDIDYYDLRYITKYDGLEYYEEIVKQEEDKKIIWSSPYSDRIMIPFIFEKKFAGFTARSTSVLEKVKYISAMGVDIKELVLYNYDAFFERKGIPVIVEGSFDAINVSKLQLYFGIGTLGKAISYWQLDTFARVFKETNRIFAIYLPDYDVPNTIIKDNLNTLESLVGRDKIMITRLPKGIDAGSATLDELSGALHSAYLARDRYKLFM